MKLYIYGYLNAVPSSRRLEREAGRNVELMWLTERLAPDHRTIADFRKEHGPAIQQACAQFVMLCRELGLFSKAIVAVDGSTLGIAWCEGPLSAKQGGAGRPTLGDRNGSSTPVAKTGSVGLSWPIAPNRKNARFAGTGEGGAARDVVASLIDASSLNGVEPNADLAEGFARLAMAGR